MEATKTLRLAEFPNAYLETFAAIINNITAHKTFISQYSSNLSIIFYLQSVALVSP